MSVVITKRFARSDGTYLEVDVNSNGSVTFDITDRFGGYYSQGDTSVFTIDGNEVNELREVLS